MTWIGITVALVALAFGVWMGLGAPGWPHKEPPPGTRHRRLPKRSINPVQWKRSGSERPTSRRR